MQICALTLQIKLVERERERLFSLVSIPFYYTYKGFSNRYENVDQILHTNIRISYLRRTQTTRWGTFKSYVVIHKPLERTGASWLCQKDSIITLNKLSTRYIYVEQPVDPMNSMSRN